MRKRLWDRRIPTLFGILLILIGIGTTTYLVRTGVIVIGKASPSEQPENVRITNITDTSFTVSFKTTKQATGTISFGKNINLGSVAIDDRDQKIKAPSPYNVHHITVRNLLAQTQYFFSITSGQSTFLNEGVPFEVTTGSLLESQPPEQEPMSGKVVLPDGTKPKEALLYVTTPNGQMLSTLVNSSGGYILPLNSLRTRELSFYLTLSQDSILTMLLVSDQYESQVKLLATQVSPVPTITLSKQYDFASSSEPVASVSSGLRFPSFSAKVVSGRDPEIVNPKKDEGFVDSQPVFRGTALPGSQVNILIESQHAIAAKVTADGNGNWSYRPTQGLPPGTHIITIQTPDKFGILKSIKQQFVIFAQGSQVQESATPSAAPTITITPTTPPLIPTVSPTPTLIPLATPTHTPTPPLTVTVTSVTPSAGGQPPQVGNSSFLITALATGITTAIGILLFFLSRGSTSL